MPSRTTTIAVVKEQERATTIAGVIVGIAITIEIAIKKRSK